MNSQRDRFPTERGLLGVIVRRYRRDFYAFDRDRTTRFSRTYIPIDVDAVGDELGIDGDVVFSFLWHHLENKHGWTDHRGEHAHFFAPKLGDERNCINYTFAAAILGGLRDEDAHRFRTVSISVLSLIVSLFALLFSLN